MGCFSDTSDFAVTEEDILEYVCQLQGKDTRPANLFDQLRENHLLIIGNSYPDWLTRFFIRAVKASKVTDLRNNRNEYLASTFACGDARLTGFLRTFSHQTIVYPGGDPLEFVRELCVKCKNLPTPSRVTRESTAADEMPEGAVFLSYASEDIASARNLKESLDAAGIDAWFDKERLKPGDNWAWELEKNIQRCTYFVPLISQTTEKVLEGVFRREWQWAVERTRDMDDHLSFILPVVVDDTSPKSDKVPRKFLNCQWSRLPGGKATGQFIGDLRDLVRKARKTGRCSL